MPYAVADPRLRAVTRTVRSTGYAALMAAGIILLAVGDPPFGPFYKALGGFAILGGFLSAVGTITGRWVEELLGLPLVCSALFTFALLDVRDTWDAQGWVSAVSVAILAGFSVLLGARWIDVYAFARTTTRATIHQGARRDD